MSKEDCSFYYASVDWVIPHIVQLGPGMLQAKMGMQRAYRNVSVSPADQHLLGFIWEGKVYIDKVLPFSLRSVPLIFSAVANALLWIMHCRGVTWENYYVDHFLTRVHPNSAECQLNMEIMLETCIRACLPLEPTFLGVELDTTTMEICLPQDKLSRATEAVIHWRS